MNKADLQKRLQDAEIPFQGTDLKHQLQGLMIMYSLGLLQSDTDQALDENLSTLLSRISRWCKMLVQDQMIFSKKDWMWRVTGGITSRF